MTVCALLQLKEVEGYEPGQQLSPDEIFKVGEMVDVAGTSNGKGFQGECPPMTCLQNARFLHSILMAEAWHATLHTRLAWH